MFFATGAPLPGVLQDRLQRGACEIEAVIIRTPEGEMINDSERLCISVEPLCHLSFADHEPVELFFGNMAERRMAQIVCQTGGLDHIRINTSDTVCLSSLPLEQHFRNASTDLRDFQGVRQSIVKDMAFIRRQYLGYLSQSLERGGIENSITIALRRTPIIQPGFCLEAIRSQRVGCHFDQGSVGWQATPQCERMPPPSVNIRESARPRIPRSVPKRPP